MRGEPILKVFGMGASLNSSSKLCEETVMDTGNCELCSDKMGKHSSSVINQDLEGFYLESTQDHYLP
jgi:hypothetical protein